MPRSLIPVITPHGSLRLDQADDDFVPKSGLADRLEKSFERGSAHGILPLRTSEAGSVLPASFAWWRDFGKAFCHLTRKQAALYQAAVGELEENLKQSGDGIARRGLTLSSLMPLKQICNHPSQWLGDGAYDENDSGKFERLREIGEAVASRQEKLLVFTQFKEIIPSLERLLAAAFGRPGLALH